MKFSCIVPVFNESERAVRVIETLLSCARLEEIIVVDDGSSDDTWERISAVKHPKLGLVRHERNLWKAKAVFTGIGRSNGEYIVLIDSDLLNLKTEHVDSLLNPVLEGSADVTISMRENSLLLYKLFRNDFVTGERVVPKSLLNDEEHFTSGPWFGLEVKMNERIIAAGHRVRSVYLPWVITPRKSVKYGWLRWTLWDLRMIGEILSVMPMHRLAFQLWTFYRHQKLSETENRTTDGARG